MGMGCHFLLQGIFLTQGSNPVSFISFFAGRFFNAESLGKPHVLETQIYNKFTNFEDLKSSLALHVELDAPLNLSCIYSIHFSFSGLEIILVCLRRINHNTGTKTHFQWQKKEFIIREGQCVDHLFLCFWQRECASPPGGSGMGAGEETAFQMLEPLLTPQLRP